MGNDLTQALRTAHSGLLVNQQALDLVARNIANVNTPGYSRKIVNLEQRTLDGHGAGVQFGTVGRRIDQELLGLLRREQGALSQQETENDTLERLQQLFGSPESNTSISHAMAELQSAIEALALTPHESLNQHEMVRWGEEVAGQLRRSSLEVQALRRQADTQIETTVEEATELLQKISDYNVDIVRNRSAGHSVADLEDQRDQAFDRLSELMDVRYSRRSSGSMVVFTAGGRTLVDSTTVELSHIAAANVGATVTDAAEGFDGIYAGERIAANDITHDVKTGKLKGLIDLRDSILPALQSSLDELSAQLRDVVNAIHNRGVAYPGNIDLHGTRVFRDPATETIAYSGAADTALILFDADGVEVARTTVRTLLGAVSPAASTTTIDDLATALDGWTPTAAIGDALDVSVNAEGKLDIHVNAPGLTLALRDQTATAAGSAAADAGLQYDADGVAGTPLRSFSGFSSFFGLNDFYVDGTGLSVHETAVHDASWQYSGANTTLTLRNAGVGTATVTISSGDDLEAIVAKFEAVSGVSAALVPDGSGVRLRIASEDGKPITITEADGGSGNEPFLEDSLLSASNAGSSTSIAVRSDILSTPALVARGSVQWDASQGPAGRYALSVGDNSSASALAAAFADFSTFDVAGRMRATSATFVEYASSFVADVSTLASSNKDASQFQSDLVDSLRQKSDSLRGVNLDEEVNDLMLYEQAYSAAARVITVVQQMFDALEQAVR